MVELPVSGCGDRLTVAVVAAADRPRRAPTECGEREEDGFQGRTMEIDSGRLLLPSARTPFEQK